MSHGAQRLRRARSAKARTHGLLRSVRGELVPNRVRCVASAGAYSKQMTTPSGARRQHLASSPFQPEPEPTIEQYAIADLVCHDVYGVGHVTRVEVSAVTVDFGQQTVRIISPFHKMQQL